MTTIRLRAPLVARARHRLRAFIARACAPPPPPEWPSHERLREGRAHARHVTSAPHIIAVGGRIDIFRLRR